MDPLIIILLSIVALVLGLPLAVAVISSRGQSRTPLLEDKSLWLESKSVSFEEIAAKLENSILEREIRGLPDKPTKADLSSDTIRRIDTFAWKIKGISRTWQSLSELLQDADVSIDRAYGRVCKRLKTAHEMAASSEANGQKLETEIASREEERAMWRARADSVLGGGSQALSNTAATRLGYLDESISEMSLALTNLRTHSVLIADSLFRCERIVVRLRVIKDLLKALPGSANEERLQYRRLLEAVARFLEQRMDSNAHDSPNDLEPRIAALESRVLMDYIRICKKEPKPLSSWDSARLAHAIAKLARELEELQSAEQTEFDTWNTLAELSAKDNRQVVLAIAASKRDQCAIILKSLKRSLEVLSATADSLSTRRE